MQRFHADLWSDGTGSWAGHDDRGLKGSGIPWEMLALVPPVVERVLRHEVQQVKHTRVFCFLCSEVRNMFHHVIISLSSTMPIAFTPTQLIQYHLHLLKGKL